MKNWIGFMLLFAFSYPALNAQNVVVSDPIDLKNNGHYQIIGEYGHKILLFRDNAGDMDILAFDRQLQKLWSKELKKEYDQVKTAGIVAGENAFHVFLAYRVQDSTFLYHYSYDMNVNLIEEKKVILKSNEISSSFYFTHSKNRKKVLLFQSAGRSSMRLLSYDLPTKSLDWHQVFEFDERVKDRFLGVELSNEGEAYLLMDVENKRFGRDEHLFSIFYYKKNMSGVQSYSIPFTGFLTQSGKIIYDDINQELNVCGYYTRKIQSRAEGIFYFTFHPQRENTEIVRHEWNNEVKENVYGPQGPRAEGINHLDLNKVVLREDGGILLVGEIEKIFERRANYSQRSVYNGGSNWVDYIYEDLILVSLHPDGSWHWSKVLHKRQFSQDDNAIYSSFYTFHVPSFIRLIYNDEISNNSTASAYEVFTDGSYARTSVLSTQYQKLQLRFQQAVQYSSNALIVPSEFKGTLKLVRIKF